MCANDQVLCHEEYCPYARDYFVKAPSGIVQRLLETWADDARRDLRGGEGGGGARSEGASRSRTEAAGRDLRDHNYVFDPYVALTEFAAGNDLSHVILGTDRRTTWSIAGAAICRPSSA